MDILGQQQREHTGYVKLYPTTDTANAVAVDDVVRLSQSISPLISVQQARLTLCLALESPDVPCWCKSDTSVSARDIRQMAARDPWMIAAVAFLVRFSQAATCCAMCGSMRSHVAKTQPYPINLREGHGAGRNPQQRWWSSFTTLTKLIYPAQHRCTQGQKSLLCCHTTCYRQMLAQGAQVAEDSR